MGTITVIEPTGKETAVSATAGSTLMEVIRGKNFSEFLAVCGGELSCATCHVYIDTKTYKKLPAPSTMEAELIDSLEHRRRTSRLSCQVVFGPIIDEARVEIAPSE